MKPAKTMSLGSMYMATICRLVVPELPEMQILNEGKSLYHVHLMDPQ
jgi:hypothetical protein